MGKRQQSDHRTIEADRACQNNLDKHVSPNGEAGLIERIHFPTVRRTVRIRLTKTAKQFKAQYEQKVEEMNQIFYREFSDEEILTLETALGKVLKNLTEKENHLE